MEGGKMVITQERPAAGPAAAQLPPGTAALQWHKAAAAAAGGGAEGGGAERFEIPKQLQQRFVEVRRGMRAVGTAHAAHQAKYPPWMPLRCLKNSVALPALACPTAGPCLMPCHTPRPPPAHTLSARCPPCAGRCPASCAWWCWRGRCGRAWLPHPPPPRRLCSSPTATRWSSTTLVSTPSRKRCYWVSVKEDSTGALASWQVPASVC